MSIACLHRVQCVYSMSKLLSTLCLHYVHSLSTAWPQCIHSVSTVCPQCVHSETACAGGWMMTMMMNEWSIQYPQICGWKSATWKKLPGPTPTWMEEEEAGGVSCLSQPLPAVVLKSSERGVFRIGSHEAGPGAGAVLNAESPLWPKGPGPRGGVWGRGTGGQDTRRVWAQPQRLWRNTDTEHCPSPIRVSPTHSHSFHSSLQTHVPKLQILIRIIDYSICHGSLWLYSYLESGPWWGRLCFNVNILL